MSAVSLETSDAVELAEAQVAYRAITRPWFADLPFFPCFD
jgi:hypothetical protein